MDTVLASDHRGLKLKNFLIKKIQSEIIEDSYNKIIDLGPFSDDYPSDYPDYAFLMAEKIKQIQNNKYPHFGILICASGIGMSISANRFPWIRAALCRNKKDVILARSHNNANILVLGSNFIQDETAFSMYKLFYKTEFIYNKKYYNRVKKMTY
ncbi:RpiB/LacA/LacB family sugar-phosphate isomerase [Lyticum sinuosum]|uniref:Ribose-5-phosphate isomerase B n=1 Tax=Lyticum sinuosum TaxID=1332059 RepID=A0AAE5AHU0_9RICK|nr:RpiB/LacA/LacB family sugar-phosphate isomerase [Lyticum sinuosum]MDZ5761164.1 putative ribose-5-phosphate isomerase B [Lyticum sinuosum]